VLASAAEPSWPGGGYGWLLLRTLLALGAVLLLAWLVIRFGLRRLADAGPARRAKGARLEVLERRGLGPRAALFAVRAGSRVFLVGSSEAGVRLLSELPAADWAEVGADERPPGGPP
jgi:flagellar biogenesis protein FliO